MQDKGILINPTTMKMTSIAMSSSSSASTTSRRSQTTTSPLSDTHTTRARQLAKRIVALWGKLGISNVVVENGTLPESIIYTKALYLTIEHYGQRHALERFM
jgi:hypothetical protein